MKSNKKSDTTNNRHQSQQLQIKQQLSQQQQLKLNINTSYSQLNTIYNLMETNVSKGLLLESLIKNFLNINGTIIKYQSITENVEINISNSQYFNSLSKSNQKQYNNSSFLQQFTYYQKYQPNKYYFLKPASLKIFNNQSKYHFDSSSKCIDFIIYKRQQKIIELIFYDITIDSSHENVTSKIFNLLIQLVNQKQINNFKFIIKLIIVTKQLKQTICWRDSILQKMYPINLDLTIKGKGKQLTLQQQRKLKALQILEGINFINQNNSSCFLKPKESMSNEDFFFIKQIDIINYKKNMIFQNKINNNNEWKTYMKLFEKLKNDKQL